MDGIVGWSGETPDLFFATLQGDRAGTRRYMVVEALPQGGWDWAAWADDGSGRSLHGMANCRKAAMKAAERGVALLGCQSVAPMPAMAILH